MKDFKTLRMYFETIEKTIALKKYGYVCNILDSIEYKNPQHDFVLQTKNPNLKAQWEKRKTLNMFGDKSQFLGQMSTHL